VHTHKLVQLCTELSVLTKEIKTKYWRTSVNERKFIVSNTNGDLKHRQIIHEQMCLVAFIRLHS